MKAFPVYLDFTTERYAHKFKITGESIDLFAENFALINCTLIFDPMEDNVYEGDVIYARVAQNRTGMFKILEISPDNDVENFIYCVAIFCGYRITGKPTYFKGFLNAWYAKFPPKELPTPIKSDKQGTDKLYSKYDNEGVIIIGVIILSTLLCSTVCLFLLSLVGGS